MGAALRVSALTVILISLGASELLAQSESGWSSEDFNDSNNYSVHRGDFRRIPYDFVAPSAVGRLDHRLQAPSYRSAEVETRAWYRLPPTTFARRDLLGSESFFGSRPLNYGQGYGTGFGPSYFGNFGNAYGTGESRSYFGNYGVGYGVGESRKY